MRLVCPNCEAKYEVPDDAIPETGRDVQCTNCGHSWYQMRGRTGAAPLVVTSPPAPSPDASAVAIVEVSTGPIDAQEPVAEPAPVAESVPDPEVQTAETSPLAADEALATVDVEELVVAEPEHQDAKPAAEASADLVQDDLLVEADLAAPPDAEPLKDGEAAEIAGEGSIDFVTSRNADAGLAMATEVETTPEAVEATEDAMASVAADEVIADPVAAEAVPDVAPETTAIAAAEAVDDDRPAPAPDYAVDDSVLAILREEAEREANARRAEALESQTDLGIDSAMPRKSGLPAVEAETKPAARRDLLPDVEEINSTLRPSEMHDGADAPDFVAPPPEAPRGFRSGFLSLMTIAILAAALYLVAPRLAVIVPALAGPLESYISMIDSLRLGLDGMMRSATVAISDG